MSPNGTTCSRHGNVREFSPMTRRLRGMRSASLKRFRKSCRRRKRGLECAPPIVVSPAIRLRGCSPRGRRFKPTCLMRLRARQARCGTQTSRNTSRPAGSSVRCGVHTSRLGRRRRARRAAFCAAWPTARSALSLPLRRKASKPFSKAIRATISKSPMCAWRRRFVGRFRIVARIGL